MLTHIVLAGVTGEAKDREPYRAVLGLLEQRLEDTVQWTDKLLTRMESDGLFRILGMGFRVD